MINFQMKRLKFRESAVMEISLLYLPKYGIPYNRTIKGDVKFIDEIFKQYEKWKSEHGGNE